MIILTGEINHRPARDLVRRISLQSALLEDGHFTAWLLVSINLSYTSIALYTHLHHKLSDIKFYKKECSLRSLLSMFSLTCYSFWHRVCFYVLFLLEYVYFFLSEWGPSWFFIVHRRWKDYIFSFPVSLWALPSNVRPGQYPEVAPLIFHHLQRIEELSINAENNQVFLWASNCAWTPAMWWSHCCTGLQTHSSWLSQLFFTHHHALSNHNHQ